MEKNNSAFIYDLDSLPEEEVLYQDKLIEFIRQQIMMILEIVVLTYNGQELKVDGFKWWCDRKTIYDIYKRDSKNTDYRSEGGNGTK